MASLYNGFSVHQMMNFIHRFYDEVKIEALQPSNTWRLQVFNEKLGQGVFEGSLFRVVYLAFKPYLQEAQTCQAKAQCLFRGVILNRQPLTDDINYNNQQLVSPLNVDEGAGNEV